ncbi:MAG TPA: hypothetical protein VGP39_17740 [Bradyrhizobium sp.]|nr:hypothetical protein [Bradyrhizobium sp.]
MVAAFALLSILFTFARFSFGYLVGFYLYSMIFGYLWINCFSTLEYDHRLGGFSAAVSAIAFLLPALFTSSPIRQRYVLSKELLGRLLISILLFAAATMAVAALYNFRLVGIEDIYNFREQLDFPTFISYSIGIASAALLPFAYACFIARRNYWLAAAVLLLLLLYYPITLSKLAFFTPAWLVAMTLLARLVEARTAVILSLLLPLLAGLLLVVHKTADATIPITDAVRYFYTVNFRILAVPAAAMDVYSDFFSKHELTHFCQISFLKRFVACPYQDQMSIVMERAYKLGNFNASMFATEGIASMGLWLAPIALFGCGLVIALGNRLSAGLPPGFILVSGAVFPQILLNVPLSVALVTHGGAVLFLLWYITPRTMFEPDAADTA